jgi:hypothetical protein
MAVTNGMLRLLFIVRAIDRVRRWAFVGNHLSRGPLAVCLQRPGGHMYRLSAAIWWPAGPEAGAARTSCHGSPLCQGRLIPRSGQSAPVLAGVKQSALDAGCGWRCERMRGMRARNGLGALGVWSLWRVREVACPKSRRWDVSRSRWSQSRFPVALPGPSPCGPRRR